MAPFRRNNREDRIKGRAANREGKTRFGSGNEGNNFFKDLELPEVSLAEAVSLGLPIASYFDNKKAVSDLMKQGIDVSLDLVDPVIPGVTSMQAPSFSQKTQLPQGSSLAEREAAVKFGEAQGDAREEQFNLANQRFMQSRADQAAQIANQAEQYNAQTAGMESRINQRTRLQQIAAAQNQANASIEAGLHNFVGMANNRAMIDAGLDAQVLESLITSGEYTTEDIKKILQNVRGSKFTKRADEILANV